MKAFYKVALPLIRSSLVSGLIFAFILSFSDINIAIFLTGPHTNTLPLQIFSDIQWQGDPDHCRRLDDPNRCRYEPYRVGLSTVTQTLGVLDCLRANAARRRQQQVTIRRSHPAAVTRKAARRAKSITDGGVAYGDVSLKLRAAAITGAGSSSL